jgi:hypothetical protein
VISDATRAALAATAASPRPHAAPTRPRPAPTAPLPPEAAPAPPTLDAAEAEADQGGAAPPVLRSLDEVLGRLAPEPPPAPPPPAEPPPAAEPVHPEVLAIAALEDAHRAAAEAMASANAALLEAQDAFGRTGLDDAWEAAEVANVAATRARLRERSARLALHRARGERTAAVLAVKRARLAELRAALTEAAIAERAEPFVPPLATLLEQLDAVMPPFTALQHAIGRDLIELRQLAADLGVVDDAEIDQLMPGRVEGAAAIMSHRIARRLHNHARAHGLLRADCRALACAGPPPPHLAPYGDGL